MKASQTTAKYTIVVNAFRTTCFSLSVIPKLIDAMKDFGARSTHGEAPSLSDKLKSMSDNSLTPRGFPTSLKAELVACAVGKPVD